MSLALIQKRIGRVRLFLRLLYVLAGVSRILLLLGLYLLVHFALDLWLHLPLAVRAAFQVAALAALAWLSWRHLLFPLFYPISSDDIAKHVERENPFLQGRLIATLQLSRLIRQPDYADSVALTEAVFRETDGLLGRVNFTRMLRPGKVAAAGLLPAAAWTGVALVAILLPLQAKIWFARNVLFRPVDWPRSTTVALVLRAYPVPPGQAVPLTVALSEEEAPGGPESVEVYLRHRSAGPEDEEWEEFEMERAADGTFAAVLPPATEEIVFYLSVLPVDREELAYVPDPDRRSPFYLLVPQAGLPATSAPGRGIEIRLPDARIETSAGVYPMLAYVEGKVPREVSLRGEAEGGGPLEIHLTQKAAESRDASGEARAVPTRFFERGIDLAESCHVHLAAGDDDDEEPVYEISVLVPPELLQATLWMEYPEYMNRRDEAWDTYLAVKKELADVRARLGSGELSTEESTQLQEVELRFRNVLSEVERAERKTCLGSRIHVETRASQPLREAWLVFDRSPLPRPESRVAIPPAGDDKKTLAATIDLDNRFDRDPGRAPGTGPDVTRVEFHFEVLGESGLSNRRHTTYTLQVVRDRTPEFGKILPFASETRLERVPTAHVDFTAEVTDDHGLAEIAIELFTDEGEAPSERIVLFSPAQGESLPLRREIRHRFELSRIEKVEKTSLGERRRALEEGDTVRFRVLATDNRRVERLSLAPQVGAAGFFTIAVVSKSRILEQTDKDLGSLKNLILDMKSRETQIREGTEKAADDAQAGQDAESLREPVLRLRNEQNDRITRMAEGIAVELVKVNQRFVDNDLQAERPIHLVEMLPLIDEVAKDLSPAVVQKMEELLAAADAPGRSAAAEAAIDRETEILARLDELLGLLGKWENYYEVVQEARRLRDLQERVNQMTRERFE
ncbi:MAG: hypothetical protein HY720_03635 [Planctomycetes bacterium]|nr:hypothetical protein [Planctomycetota bacterium]